MKLQYFADSDTLYIDMADRPISRTDRINYDFLVDYDANGVVVGITLEHAAARMDLSSIETEDLPTKALKVA